MSTAPSVWYPCQDRWDSPDQNKPHHQSLTGFPYPLRILADVLHGCELPLCLMILRELTATAVRIRLRHIPLVGILCSSAILMQGCTVVAWIGMVSADTARNSAVKFESFEHAWVAPPEKQQQVPLKRIAVTPFVGDLRMAEWWATILGQATDRDVISPAEVTSRLPPNVLTQLIQSTTDQDDIALVPQISRVLQVDGVLFGRVVDGPPQKVFLGFKERYRQRLYLHLVSVEGTLLWKVELPFTVVKGTKEIDEEVVKQNLLTHVTTHAKELGWTELGLAAAHTR